MRCSRKKTSYFYENAGSEIHPIFKIKSVHEWDPHVLSLIKLKYKNTESTSKNYMRNNGEGFFSCFFRLWSWAVNYNSFPHVRRDVIPTKTSLILFCYMVCNCDVNIEYFIPRTDHYQLRSRNNHTHIQKWPSSPSTSLSSHIW